MLKNCISATDREASIVSTLQSSCYKNLCADLLLDGKGLNGRLWIGAPWSGPGYCAATATSPGNNWFSLELALPHKISRVQIIPRLDCFPRCKAFAEDIRITNGPSKLQPWYRVTIWVNIIYSTPNCLSALYRTNFYYFVLSFYYFKANLAHNIPKSN